MKKWMKWLLAVLAVLLVCALLLPFPRKVKRTLSGLAYAPGGEGVACTINVDATRLCCLIREDTLKGSLALSTDPRTQGATLDAAETPAFKGHSGGCFQLTGYQADGTPFTAGLFIAPADMSWSYVQNRTPDGMLRELMAPAATDEEAQAIRERARDYYGVIPG